MDVKEKFFAEMEKELMLLDPIDDVEAFLNCARYNEDDDGQLLREYLVKHPNDVDARDSQGRTAVHMAAANGHMPILEMLFEFHPSPNVGNHEGNTALHFAALNNRVEVARRLIAAGWSASATNCFERTPFQLIQGKRFDDMEALLLEHDESLDTYELPAGASVDVTDGNNNEEEEEEEEEEKGEKVMRQTASPAPQSAPANTAPTKELSQGGASKSASRATASVTPTRCAAKATTKKVEGGVLGTTNLDGVE